MHYVIRLGVTQTEYNQHVTRCAQLALGLHPGNKSIAKETVGAIIAGTRVCVAGTAADAIATILFSTHAHAACDALPLRAALADVAWACHVADVRAKIDTLP